MLKTISLAAALALTATAALAETPTITDITGTWTGTGFVQKNEKSKPMNVKCEVEGAQSGDEVSFDGYCRAMIIVKRAIGAQLVRSGDTYTGTYTGSDAGVAKLDGGEPKPGLLDLEMQFPRDVNGDAVARMVIETPSEDSFTIRTTDMMESGVEVVTSEVTFEREASVAEN
ncbi:hypothetical protein RDV64_02385 [Acuticoccus sp. MNP-M23]|uniref:hypothetical protein n=1 Tax=Acuticoccus sp. MNP-M23 TaxID=3072793 RepID=UPI002815937A|nr:hypothetical protein [Acuticoccus sp. MNP-M23]WMS43272.1 hypothetical protein RDV64_02385 [Acuticoccus sp. MNP-M23]